METQTDKAFLDGYLGKGFQKRLFSFLLLDKQFGKDIVPHLNSHYYDDPYLKQLFSIVKNYHQQYEVIPNGVNLISLIHSNEQLQGKVAEQEALRQMVYSVNNFYQDEIKSGTYEENRLFVRDRAFHFIKQQEFKKALNKSIGVLQSGKLEEIDHLMEQFTHVQEIGKNRNHGTLIHENVEQVLDEEYRNPVPTMIPGLDDVMDGGPGGGQACVIIAPSGVGKTTMLTRIAHGARSVGKNVVQVIFEDTIKDVQRKHYACMANLAVSDLSENKPYVKQVVEEARDNPAWGKLVIVKFEEDLTTMKDIRAWILDYERLHGIKFDLLVLDYLDCVEAHKEKGEKLNEELVVMKGFLSLLAELNIPGWTAIQGNRDSIGSRIVGMGQIGGNIKRAQKGHFIISIGRELAQKVNGTANLAIVKSRFSKDGMVFENCIFNNDTLDIRISGHGDSSGGPLPQLKDSDIVNAILRN